MPVKKKALILSIIAFVVIIGLVFFQFRSLNNVGSVWNTHLSEAVKRQRLLSVVQAQFGYGGFIHNFKNHVLRGQDKFVDRFEKNKVLMLKTIAELETVCKETEEQQAIKEIKMVAQKYIDAIVTSKKMHADGKTPTEIDKVVKIDDSPAFKAFRVIDNIASAIEVDGETKMHASIITVKSGVAIGFVIIFIAFGSFIFLLFSLVNKMGKLKTFAGKVGAGDLTAMSGIDGKDEIATIAGALDTMAHDLNTMFVNVINNSESLADASQELSGTSSQIHSNADDVQGKSQNVSAAAEEMSVNMNSVAAAVEQASSSIGLVSQSAGNMLQMITDISQNTESARNISNEAVDTAKNASSKVNELGNAAKGISKVTETISDISEQTNLLALNATIEAARAGEAGKGFGVVANEIKDLAAQTGQATEEIKGSIDSIQTTMESTVSQINQISSVINRVNEIVSTIDTAVEKQSASTTEIASNVSEASQGLNEIAQNVAQSSVVAGEVAKDIVVVNDSALNMSQSSSMLNDQSSKLSDLAQELNVIVGRFTI